MFTGIVEATAIVFRNEGSRLTIERPNMFDDIKRGSSISVSGVCLSITALDHEAMTFDVVDETLSTTKLGNLTTGNRVNLERSMRADARLEGHVVQGHVEGTARVTSNEPTSNRATLTIEISNNVLAFVVQKGSIAIDGVSLTVASLEGNRCTVALIPHTIEHTTLGALKENDLVNIETDILGRYSHPSPT